MEIKDFPRRMNIKVAAAFSRKHKNGSQKGMK